MNMREDMVGLIQCVWLLYRYHEISFLPVLTFLCNLKDFLKLSSKKFVQNEQRVNSEIKWLLLLYNSFLAKASHFPPCLSRLFNLLYEDINGIKSCKLCLIFVWQGMKVSCTHFQCAAWAFEHLKDNFSTSSMSTDMGFEILSFHIILMLVRML